MKKIIKVFFCILTCLIISIPQIYAEESKTTKELSEAVEEKKDENVEEALDKEKKEVTEESAEQSVLETIEKPAEVTSNGTTELPKTESTSETEEKPDEEPSICYTTHIQDIGWQNQVKDGEMAGTEGQAKRLEAIKITLKDLSGVKIKYQTHIQDIGWQDWKYDGTLAGTEGQSKRLEAIKIELEESDKYSIMYRVHIQDIGWQDWRYDGEKAGTEGQSKRLEAIQIKIVDKQTSISVNYSVHVQDIGWQNLKTEEKIAGTEGQSKRLEAIKIELLTNIKNLKLKYRVHIQDIGWQDWKGSEEMAGTEGQSKRLEAIQIKLENTQDYSIEYRVHVQDIGWQDWVKDGEISGTEGQSKRLEAIQIRIISKENDSDSQEEPKFERQEGTYGKTGLNVADKGGSELKYLKYGTGKNVFFATFAIHGYEDKWDKDGYELIEIANNFYNKLLEDKDYDLAKKWTIYIFPGVNQDGLQEGSTNNGPGRTTLYSQAPQNKGIDLNRCWQIGSTYEKFTSDRNYNGDIGFQAYEAQALRDFMLKNKSKDGQTILVDLHGWTQQLIGDENICSYYEQQFPENNKRSVGRYGSGYMISWGRTYLGSQGKPAKTALIELPRDGVKNHQSVIDKDFSNRYIYATMKMLEKII
ncbi:MAG: M14 family zinc carboxypeptidase [Clostridia bacterium]|nr:M14 family zinc carboxypeptidase [Clostridia bacterium]